MIITNKLNLPKQFVVEEYKEPIENTYSVTELLNPTREIILNRKYFKEISIDVSDQIVALFGTAVHDYMEKHKPDNCEAEYSILYKFGNITIKGRCDLVDFVNLIIEDYKTCSVSKIIEEKFEDWKKQGLLYALIIYLSKNIKIKKLKFYALMKDWSKIKSVTNSNYPTSPIYVWEYDIEDSDLMYIQDWLFNKLLEIKEYKNQDCSDEDKWYTGTKYAIYKKAGDKRAAYIADIEQEAHDYITNKLEGAGEIEVRKGEYRKCKYYCKCYKFCEKEKENGR